MPNDDDHFEFPNEIRAAFESYPQPRTSPEFEARFWTSLDARRGRYRGFAGFWRRVIEVEIEGVAVWRLALSTVSGGASCALVFGAFALFSMPRSAPVASKVALRPADDASPETPRMAFEMRHFYAREWEAEVGTAPRIAPIPRQKSKSKSGGEISWNGSKNRWA